MSETNGTDSNPQTNKAKPGKNKVAPAPAFAEADLALAQRPADRLGTQASGDDNPIQAALLRGPEGVFGSGSLEMQAGRLNDPRLATVQRQALAAQIGRVQGNRHLGQVLASRKQNKIIQRYAVGVPTNASCAEVIDWLNSSNPHVPNWAKTRARFNWGGSFLITGTAPDFHLRVGSPQVTMIGPSVDMPQWSPSDPAMQTAWQAMVTTLRTHEGEHETIARDWKATLLQRLTDLDLEVTAANRSEVNSQAQGLIQAEWDVWLADHQTAQDAIDPFTAPLDCPATADSNDSSPGEEAE